ncbi:MAG: LPS export ABC transporter permease LptF [Acidobacteriia bacterium]|nr:LPS export ABC transporter permease LptF [Terriglobia bacterium]
MRILTRYILKEIISHALLGVLIFTFVIFVRQLGRLLEMVVRHDLPLASTLTLFVLPVPSILVLTIPMAILVGTLIGLSRMAADGEVIAVRAAGIGLAQFIRPVMMLALAGWGLTLWMSMFLGPQAARKLNHMETGLKASQVPYEIQPRVFIEQFPNLLLYLEDVTGSRSRWRGVFIADITQHEQVKVTLAESGVLVNEPAQDRLMLHLEHGTTHQIDSQHPEQYSVVSFTDTDIPIPLDQGGAPAVERRSPPLLSASQLLAMTGNPRERQAAVVEWHYRLALPVATLVLALVGIPLGLSTRKGGKAVGLMLTILLVFIYYIMMAFGLSLAKQGRISPVIGLWMANLLFAVAGILMLANLRRVRTRLQIIQDVIEDVTRWWQHRRARPRATPLAAPLVAPRPAGGRFLQILDLYVIRGWTFYFGILLVTFTGVYAIFDFFQLLGDIVRTHTAVTVVLNYYRFLLPQVMYLMLPLSILVATLVNFSLLTKTNQIVAMKSAGISLYRVCVPVLLAAAILSVGMFGLEDRILPETNQRQSALRNQIKGKPAQTFYRPDRQWIFGESNRIYNYRFFDPDQNIFGHLSVFELNPQSFTMTRRIYAERAFWEEPIHGWVLENGWVRDLDGDRVTHYMPFSVATFRELSEPPTYFKKEVRTSEQMSVLELRRYINELRQSGFDVVRLSVQFYTKFSFPLIAFVITLIAIPFSFSLGGKGALSGVAVSIGIAILYWSISGLFEAMGNLSQLPPSVAAWSPDVLFGLAGVYMLLRVKT